MGFLAPWSGWLGAFLVLPVHCGCWWPTAAVIITFLQCCLVVLVAFGPVDVVVVEPRCWSCSPRDGCPLELVWECLEVTHMSGVHCLRSILHALSRTCCFP